MQPDSKIPSASDNPERGGVPPTLPSSETPLIGAPGPLVGGSLPSLPPKPTRNSLRHVLAIILSLCLGLFVADAIVSLLDDSLILFFGVHILSPIRGLVFVFAMLMALLTYGLMGLTPMIPKRLFLPVTLFGPVAGLAVVLC